MFLVLIRVIKAAKRKTFLINVFIDFWKKLLFERAINVGAEANTSP